MRLEVGKLAEITKNFSPIKRREESPETCHESREFLIGRLKYFSSIDWRKGRKNRLGKIRPGEIQAWLRGD